MKKTLFKIMGLALTVAMLASLILGVMPVSASSISVPGVTVSPSTISTLATYKVAFQTTPYAPLSGPASTITVTFPAGTAVPPSIDNTDVWLANSTTTSTFAFGAYVNASSVDMSAYLAGIAVIHVPAGWTNVVGNISVIIGVNTGHATPGDAVIGNPGTAGGYTLAVKTSADTTAVTSGTYMINSPGIVQLYNQLGNYLGTTPDTVYIPAADTGFTVKIGPGNYSGFTVDAARVTVVSTGAGVIIGGPVSANGASCTFEALTFKGPQDFSGANITVKNCTFAKTSTPPGSAQTLAQIHGSGFTMTGGSVDTSTPSGFADEGIDVYNDGATFDGVAFKTDQTFTDRDIALYVDDYVGITIKNCTFTGVNGGLGIYADDSGVNIMNNTFTGLETAIYAEPHWWGDMDNAISITGNTISGSIVNGTNFTGAIYVYGYTDEGNVKITGNQIKDNGGYSILVEDAVPATMIVSGNNFSNNAKGLKNSAGDTLNAAANYWGNITGPTDAVGNPSGTGDKVTGLVNYQPFMTVTSTAAAAFAAPSDDPFSTAPGSIASGFSVSNYTGGGLIVGQKLSGNPAPIAPPFPAVAYFDIYASPAGGAGVQINFYGTGFTASTNVYMWSAASNSWVPVTGALSGTGTYVYVIVDGMALSGTYFAIVTGLPPAPPSFLLTSPAAGATTALLNVPFTWPTFAGATGYSIAISKSPNMSSPVVATTAGTAYVYPGTLIDGAAYFWQVTALRNTTTIAVSSISAFMAQAPPVIATTPQITITTQPAATITITQPQSTVVTFTTPATTTITPAWIWGIIGVGAVLVIVVIVLIVRTRRTT